MKRISRRNFINGTLMATGALMLPNACRPDNAIQQLDASYYPPSLTGLRGSHPGSNTHAHDKAWLNKIDWGPTTKLNEKYDLIVVGGGISGLSAAYFFMTKNGFDKRILILDNHDDFGGHAKRNEHTINGKTVISYGGSQSIVEPQHQSQAVRQLFNEIGVDTERFSSAYDVEFFNRHNLTAATYFNKAIFGADKVVNHPFCNYPNYVEGLKLTNLSNEEAVAQTPLGEKAKSQLLKVLQGGLHKIDQPEHKIAEYARTHAYFDYLTNTLGVDDDLILRMARHSALDWGSGGTDTMSIAAAKTCGALGFVPKEVYDEDNPYIYHFPDGNAGIARALVKKMIPDIAKGDNAEELVLAKFDYSKLDVENQSVRVRLNSTVVRVEHADNSTDADEVFVKYITDNTAYQVKAKSVVMACYNMMIPHIVPNLPTEQAKALRLQSKSPLQYTSVGLTNWRAFKALNIGLAMCPGNMHQAVLLDFPVSLGGYAYTKSPDEPCVIQMISCPYGSKIGSPRLEQFKEARFKMLSLQFSDYESEIRSHLSGMLPKEVFDFDRDVESITVNRWAHGYTIAGPGDSALVGRKRFGRIVIANCDSAPGADAKTAIDMAYRAINEIA